MAPRTRTLAGVLKERREALGLSVRGLADELSVAPSTILRFEDGTRRPTPELIKRLAKVLKTNGDELLALANHKLPTFAPYLRAKYDLSPEAVAELEQHFKDVSAKDSKRGRL